MTITIETASNRQLDRLYQIEKECFSEEAFSKQQIANLLMDYNTISLIAVEKGNIIGFIIGAIYSERNAANGHVLTIDVSPQHQRKGVGSKLLQELEKILAQRNIKTCRLEVKENNIKALGLYEKAGYQRIGRLKNYYGNADGLYLQKDLT
ncbi:MAG TPA: ribosomal protein S18-alanine N-acetyltransferase [Candidatus Acidoferrum sp.]|nr:ribosomal protein S18-alanine N-acetyltransferase [Candidatus Acidoferrum sp.]